MSPSRPSKPVRLLSAGLVCWISAGCDPGPAAATESGTEGSGAGMQGTGTSGSTSSSGGNLSWGGVGTTLGGSTGAATLTTGWTSTSSEAGTTDEGGQDLTEEGESESVDAGDGDQEGDDGDDESNPDEGDEDGGDELDSAADEDSDSVDNEGGDDGSASATSDSGDDAGDTADEDDSGDSDPSDSSDNTSSESDSGDSGDADDTGSSTSSSGDSSDATTTTTTTSTTSDTGEDMGDATTDDSSDGSTDDSAGDSGGDSSGDSGGDSGGDMGHTKPERKFRKIYDSGHVDHWPQMAQLSTGELMITSTETRSEDSGKKSIPTMQLWSLDGEIQWQKQITPDQLRQANGFISYVAAAKGPGYYVLVRGTENNIPPTLHRFDNSGTHLGMVVTSGDDEPVMLMIDQSSGDVVVLGCRESDESCRRTQYSPELSQRSQVDYQLDFNRVESGGHLAELLPNGDIYFVWQGFSPDDDAFVIPMARLKAAGGIEWNKTYKTGFGDTPWAIRVDSQERIYLAANLAREISGGGTVSVLRFTKNGANDWTFNVPRRDGAKENALRMIQVDRFDNVYLTGYVRESLPAVGQSTRYSLRRINPAGKEDWHLLGPELDTVDREGQGVDALVTDDGEIFTLGISDEFDSNLNIAFSRFGRGF